MASLFDITLSNVSVTEGGSVTITLTPTAALTQAVTVSWSILGFGWLPISSGDFSNLSGSVSFAAGDGAKTFTITPTGDALGELAEEFVVRLSQDVGGTVTELGDHQVTLNDDDTYVLSNTPFNFPAIGQDDVVTAGSSDIRNLSGVAGDDVLVVSRFQEANLNINDTLGANVIKFDHGVTITKVVINGFFSSSQPILTSETDIDVTLGNGAVVNITGLTAGNNSYQIGDGEVLSFDGFMDALEELSGGNSFTHVDFGVTNTLDFADPYTVDYPSNDGPITFPDPIPDPVVELDDYNYIEGTNNSDSFNGTEEADRFYNLRSGRDHVRGNGGNDLIESGGGYDTFNGGSEVIRFPMPMQTVMSLLTWVRAGLISKIKV